VDALLQILGLYASMSKARLKLQARKLGSVHVIELGTAVGAYSPRFWQALIKELENEVDTL
jgi:hypothetical protein